MAKEIKRFLEIEEVSAESGADKDPVIFKEEVTGKSDALSRYEKIKGSFKDKKYRAYVHVCGHRGAGKNSPCFREIIEEKV
jgi:polynucleotide 5'-kinase involved in rRNA processing